MAIATRVIRNSRDRQSFRSSIRSPRCENISLCLSNIFLMYFLILGLAIIGSGVFARAHWATYGIRGIEVGILLLWIGLGMHTSIASLLGFLAMCYRHQSLLYVVIILFSLLVCGEIVLCVFALFYCHHARSFINHIWSISTAEFRLYLEESFDCCGLFNFTDHVATPCPLGGSVRACYPALRHDLNTLLVIVFCCTIAIILAQSVFIGTLSMLLHILRNKTGKKDEVPLLSTPS